MRARAIAKRLLGAKLSAKRIAMPSARMLKESCGCRWCVGIETKKQESNMSKMKWITVMAAAMAMGLSFGCGGDDDNSDNNGGGTGGGGGSPTGSYAGTYTGKVCGRGLTMVVSQNGSTLSGSYTFSDPTFNGTFSGTVTSTTPPATAHLVCGSGHSDWWFDLSFSSYNAFTGGFCNRPETGVANCIVSGTK
jgi:hypothetical protein